MAVSPTAPFKPIPHKAAPFAPGGDGKLEHAGTGVLRITANTINGQRGQIITNGALAMSGGVINLDNASTTASQIIVNAASLTNRQGSISQTAAGRTSITASQVLNNTSGIITSVQNATITATAGLDNTQGTIETNGVLGITTTALRNVQGRITSLQDASIAASAGLDNTAGAIENNEKNNEGQIPIKSTKFGQFRVLKVSAAQQIQARPAIN